MRFRFKLFLTSGAVVLLLWAATLWPIQRTISGSFDRLADSDFAAARASLQTLRMERIARMAQASRLLMLDPDLRSLIAEAHVELTPDNVASLQERLDNLAKVLDLQFICVADDRGALIAQNTDSPWSKLPILRDYISNSNQALPLLRRLYTPADQKASTKTADDFGLWVWNGHLYQVVGLPLIFSEHPDPNARPDGALLMAIQMSDELAAGLAPTHRCDITFVSAGASLASSLPPAEREKLLNAAKTSHWPIGQPFDLSLGDSAYRTYVEPLLDPCSGEPIGNTIIQSAMADGDALQSKVSHDLLAIMTAGLLAAALLSFLVSGAITRPVRQLVRGVRRVAAGDLNSSIRVVGHDELSELAGAFNDMLAKLRARLELERQVEQAQAASKAKGQFLANMSHEIRTPLNGVIGMTELLLRTDLDVRQRRYAGLAKSSAELLTSLINDILDLSKIEAGRLEIESVDFDLQAAVEEVLDLLSARAAKKGLELSCHYRPDAPKLLRGDAARIRQVLVNLINNAIKFTDRGSVAVRVGLDPDPRSDAPLKKPADSNPPVPSSVIRIEVTDSGIGIPADRLDRLFKPFSQVDASTTRKFGGTGLGLAISRELVELMGGTIGVRSEPRRGSAFWFTVNLKNQNAEASIPAPSPAGFASAAAGVASAAAGVASADVRGLRVLAVDDNAASRDVLVEQLASWNFPAASAAGAPEALAALRDAARDARPFNVAVIDIDMPGTSGLELARLIKADPDLRQTTLIALLSMDSPVAETTVQLAGFAAQMTKPVHQSRLFDTIMNALSPASAPAQTPRVSPYPGEAKRRGKILIAEDNEVNQLVAAELVREAGFDCQVAMNGRQAVETRFDAGFDLILMDCQMPEMDGLDATREIRRRELHNHLPRVPIIALTANAVKGDRELCLAAGMDGYCSKPIDPEKLLTAINSILGGTAAPAPQPAAPPPADTAPIAVDRLVSRCMKNLNVIMTVLEKFESQTRLDVERIRTSLAENNPAAAANSAHALKGAAATIGAQTLSAVAAELEHLARAGQLDNIAVQLAQLQKHADECLSFLPRVRELAAEQLSPPPINGVRS